MRDLLGASSDSELGALADVITIGIHHEQQHQELMLMDIKHVLSCNPLQPAYRERGIPVSTAAPPMRWIAHEGGIRTVGHAGPAFAYDNEGPRHDVLVHPFELASRLITCGEYLAFIEDGGYKRPELWLSDGWLTVRTNDWRAPLYWSRDDTSWQIMTLTGPKPLDAHEPVCHVSYYEADAYTRWAGARLAGEFEWEIAAGPVPVDGNFVEAGSRLFDLICTLEEYYPTRTELGIMRRRADEIAAELGPGCTIIELGSGSSLKTRILLDHLDEPAVYIPVDISREHLLRSARALAAAYPGLRVVPVCADFTREFDLPPSAARARPRIVYFPGSTIGNFDPPDARILLRRIARLAGPDGGLLIGVDLKKDPAILERAYNDRLGVTAAFNRNLLPTSTASWRVTFASICSGTTPSTTGRWDESRCTW